MAEEVLVEEGETETEEEDDLAELYGGQLTYTSEKGYTIEYILHKPVEILRLYINTMQVSGGWYLETFLGDQLGWLYIPVSKLILYLYALLLFTASFRFKNEEVATEKKGLLVSGAFMLLSMLLIFAGMLFSWSPIKDRVISGVQGRYFIPIALPLLLLIRLMPLEKERRTDRYIILIICMVFFFVLRYLLLGLNMPAQ